ncbi:MAG: hypothetical protein CMF64_03590 [Magnetovibrio sp.]|nr:hypothetical protein [Magnetovibrio sp.]
MAAGIRQGYPDLFSRHEYANQINKNELEGLVLEVTGLEKKSQVVGAIIGTFEALKAFADFEITDDQLGGAEQEPENIKEDVRSSDGRADFQFGLGYTVNINLPETTNVAVYDAIFKSISEHLVKRKG